MIIEWQAPKFHCGKPMARLRLICLVTLFVTNANSNEDTTMSVDSDVAENRIQNNAKESETQSAVRTIMAGNWTCTKKRNETTKPDFMTSGGKPFVTSKAFQKRKKESKTLRTLTIKFGVSFNESRDLLLQSSPLLVSVPGNSIVSSTSMELPLIYDGIYYNYTERTLCPMSAHNMTAVEKRDSSVVVHVSTRIPEPGACFTMDLDENTNFLIGVGQKDPGVKVGPVTPKVRQLNFPDGIDSLKITVSSPDLLCGLVVVQKHSCPLQDMPWLVAEETLRGTIRKSLTLIAKRPSKDARTMFLILMSRANGDTCMGESAKNPTTQKHYTFQVESVTYTAAYGFALCLPWLISGIVTVFALANLSRIKISKFFSSKKPNDQRQQMSVRADDAIALEPEDVESLEANHPHQDVEEGHLISLASELDQLNVMTMPKTLTEDFDPVSQLKFKQRMNGFKEIGVDVDGHTALVEVANGHDGPSTSAVQQAIVSGGSDVLYDDGRTSPSSDVSCILDQLGPDRTGAKLSSVDHESATSEYFRFQLLVTMLFLPIICIFVVYHNHKMWTIDSGNTDQCFHNFGCAIPMAGVLAFNNLYSNVCYVLLGLLMFVIVRQKQRRYNDKRLSQVPLRGRELGVPVRFGMLYSMALALCAAGVASSLYHVCPNSNYFRFDVSFIFYLVMLPLFYMYAARHSPTQASVAYLAMTSVIVFAAISGLWNHAIYAWIIYILLQLTLLPLISLQLYYHQHLQFSLAAPRQAFSTLSALWRDVRQHNHSGLLFKERLVLLIAWNLFGISLSVGGAILRGNSVDIVNWLLLHFVSQLALYFIYYIVNKRYICHEPILPTTFGYLILASVFWILAINYFFQKTTDWSISPAASRELNSSCSWLDFYDHHDLWHIFSALAAFWSFMSVMSLDDGVKDVSRSELAVF